MTEQNSGFPFDRSTIGSPRLVDYLGPVIGAATVAFILYLSAARELAGYGTETDYLGSTVQEAERLLSGAPLVSDFHPPGYVFIVSAAYLATGDWFVAGKAISAVSAIVVLISSNVLFRLIGGAHLALGATIGLVSSATFLKYAAQATSDICFLALYSVAFMLAALAVHRNWGRAWFFVGAVIVLATMTRTNGLTLLLLLLAPLFLADRSRKITAFLAAATGMLAAAVAFWGFAELTGSNLMPKGTYHNIALTYFTAERITWEGMVEARARFDSLLDVVLYDPTAMVAGYARDLLDVTLRKIPQLSGPALALLFLPGLVVAACEPKRRLFAAFLGLTLAQLLLVNLKAYEPRYHLYFTPWIGAGTMALVAFFATRRDWATSLRIPLVAGLLGFVGVGVLLAWNDARVFAADGGNPELARALPRLEGVVGPGDIVVARKRHVAFYTGADSVLLPSVETPQELREVFETATTAIGDGGTAYLFYGEVERHFRPQIAAMISGEAATTWLDLVAQGNGPADWVLYRYNPAP